MHIKLSPEMEDYINTKVTEGFFDSATEVIRDAIGRMQTKELQETAWQSSIRQGDEELDRGEGIAYSADSLNTIANRALTALKNGDRLNPDVCP